MIEKKIRVKYDRDDRFMVIEEWYDDVEDYNYKVLFSGSLSDCEAFIRLTKEGYM